MATTIQEQPVATNNPVATPQPTQPVAPAPQTILAPLTPADVYSPVNVKQVLSGDTKSLQKMKLSKLEKQLAQGQAQAETNQVNIMNQTKAMGVLTGEAAHQSALDTARINAVTGIYNAKLKDQERKDAERKLFMDTYGADPSKRPKRMSEKEFSKALAAGKFSELMTPAFKEARASATRAAKGSGGTVAPGANKELAAVANAFTQFKGDWGATANYLASQGYDVSSGSVIDNELRRRNGLEPITSNKALTPAQQQATVNQISGQFDNEPVVRNYNVIAEGYQSANNLANKDNPTSADDQALIYAFAKAQDPNSAVREGEYTTVQKYSQAMIESGWANAKRMAENVAFLTPEARANMVAAIKTKYDVSKQNYDNIYNEYGRRIDQVTGGNGTSYLTNYGAAYTSAGGGSYEGTTSNGLKFKISH